MHNDEFRDRPMSRSPHPLIPGILYVLLLAGCSAEPPVPISKAPPEPGAEKHAFIRSETWTERPGGYVSGKKVPAGRR